jgi:ATP-dependent Zn protease
LAYFQIANVKEYSGIRNKMNSFEFSKQIIVQNQNSNQNQNQNQNPNSKFIRLYILFSAVMGIAGLYFFYTLFVSPKGGGTMGILNQEIEVSKDLGITFKDIKGIDDCLDEIKEIVDFLKNPKKYTDFGVKLPR